MIGCHDVFLGRRRFASDGAQDHGVGRGRRKDVQIEGWPEGEGRASGGGGAVEVGDAAASGRTDGGWRGPDRKNLRLGRMMRAA